MNIEVRVPGGLPGYALCHPHWEDRELGSSIGIVDDQKPRFSSRLEQPVLAGIEEGLRPFRLALQIGLPGCLDGWMVRQSRRRPKNLMEIG